VPAADDRRARRAEGDIDSSADQRRHGGDTEGDADRAAHPDRERPDPQPHAFGLQADGRGQRESVERRHLADPHRLDRGLLGGDGDLDRLLVGAVEPVRQGDADLADHSIAVSVGWSTSRVVVVGLGAETSVMSFAGS